MVEKIKYPAGEIVWVGYYNAAGDLLYIITSKVSRDAYYLYELVDGVFKKLGRGPDPADLARKYGVRERMGC